MLVAPPADAGEKQKADDLEPVFFFSMPPMWYTNIIAGYFVKHLWEFWIGEGIGAEVCLENRIGYCGFGFTTAHVQSVTERLTMKALELMCDPSKTGWYDVRCASDLKGDAEDSKPSSSKTKKGKRKNNEENAARDKPTKQKADAESDHDGQHRKTTSKATDGKGAAKTPSKEKKHAFGAKDTANDDGDISAVESDDDADGSSWDL